MNFLPPTEDALFGAPRKLYVPHFLGKHQRAANGGVRSVVVEFGVFGAPRFSVHRPQNPLKRGPLDRKSGRPKNAKFNHDGSDPPFAAL